MMEARGNGIDPGLRYDYSQLAKILDANSINQ